MYVLRKDFGNELNLEEINKMFLWWDLERMHWDKILFYLICKVLASYEY